MNGLIHNYLSEPLPIEKSEVGKIINYLMSFRTNTFERLSFYMYLNAKANRGSLSPGKYKPACTKIQPHEKTAGLSKIKPLITTPPIVSIPLGLHLIINNMHGSL
jgi:hypothetical protein